MSETLDRLRRAFPELPEQTLAAAIEQNGTYERALAALEAKFYDSNAAVASREPTMWDSVASWFGAEPSGTGGAGDNWSIETGLAALQEGVQELGEQLVTVGQLAADLLFGDEEEEEGGGGPEAAGRARAAAEMDRRGVVAASTAADTGAAKRRPGSAAPPGGRRRARTEEDEPVDVTKEN